MTHIVYREANQLVGVARDFARDLTRPVYDLATLCIGAQIPDKPLDEASRIYTVLKRYSSESNQPPLDLELNRTSTANPITVIPRQRLPGWDLKDHSPGTEPSSTSSSVLCLTGDGLRVGKLISSKGHDRKEELSDLHKPNFVSALRLAELGYNSNTISTRIAEALQLQHGLAEVSVPPKNKSAVGPLKLLKSMLDTEVLFAAGDFAAAFLTAEIFGIGINAGAAALAVGGKLYETATGSKPKGLGFFAMAGVSAVTTVSIIANGVQKFGYDLSALSAPGATDLIFGAAAFGAWTIANLVAGIRRAHQLPPTKNPVADHQSWFCLGSILATHGRPLPLLFFAAGLAKIISSQGRDQVENPTSWREFADKHLTPSRLRAVAYAISTGIVASTAPQYIIPYVLWMLGNMAFDSSARNRTLLNDFRQVLRKVV